MLQVVRRAQEPWGAAEDTRLARPPTASRGIKVMNGQNLSLQLFNQFHVHR